MERSALSRIQPVIRFNLVQTAPLHILYTDIYGYINIYIRIYVRIYTDTTSDKISSSAPSHGAVHILWRKTTPFSNNSNASLLSVNVSIFQPPSHIYTPDQCAKHFKSSWPKSISLSLISHLLHYRTKYAKRCFLYSCSMSWSMRDY